MGPNCKSGLVIAWCADETILPSLTHMPGLFFFFPVKHQTKFMVVFSLCVYKRFFFYFGFIAKHSLNDFYSEQHHCLSATFFFYKI